ncbi:MAG: hypothetical protein KAJ18_11490 [Candidatus Omnitrophica bacterium]|nr:hypothetical protein [Candidatus Omnitrophota bacterium]
MKKNLLEKFLYDPDAGVRKVDVIMGTIFCMFILFLFVYPTVPLEFELAGTGLIEFPNETTNNITVKIENIDVKFKTVVPIIGYVPTINAFSNIRMFP